MTLRNFWSMAAALVAAALPLRAYDIIRGPDGARVTWDPGPIPLVIRMASTPTLPDGSNFASSVAAAATQWNQQMATVAFSPQISSPGAAGSANGINEVAFDSSIYSSEGGEAFGPNTLAVTISYRSSSPRSDGTYRRTQADVLFNSAFSWSSYRGPFNYPVDIRRVALHELGHVLGLGHPDQAEQRLTALMNSVAGDIDSLQADDILGAQYQYGKPGGHPRPANDDFAHAISVSPSTSVAVHSGTSVGATLQPGEPNPEGKGGASVWWKFVAQEKGLVTIYTAGSNFDTLLAAYTGSSVDSLQLLASNDDAPGVFTSWIDIVVQPGVTYHFAISGWDGEYGPIQFYTRFESRPNAGPPVFGSPLADITGEEGRFVTVFSGAAGDPSPTYQWQRRTAGTSTWVNLVDSTDISGSRDTSLYLRNLRLEMTGDEFRQVATNAAGTTYSNAARLTVNKARPIVRVEPSVLEVLPNSSGTFTAVVDGSPPFTYQWSAPGGADIPGAIQSSLTVSNATASGRYRVRVSNSAGTAQAEAQLNVVLTPVISHLSDHMTIYAATTAYLTVYAEGNVTYQWYKNDAPLAGATGQTLWLSWVDSSHAGIYHVVASNLAGQTRSRDIEVVVVSTPPPFGAQLQRQNATWPGGSAYLSVSSGTGWGNLQSAQWYRDGVPIPGATSSSRSFTVSSPADYGDYFAVYTGTGGTSVTQTHSLRPGRHPNPPAHYWKHAVVGYGIVYFIFHNTPRIERYDLAAETWLSSWPLTTVPRSFAVAPDSIYVGYENRVMRHALDFSDPRQIYTHPSLQTMTCHGQTLFVTTTENDREFAHSLNRFTGEILSKVPSARVWGNNITATYSEIDGSFLVGFGSTVTMHPLRPDGTLGPFQQFTLNGKTRASAFPLTRQRAIVFDDGTVYDTKNGHFSSHAGRLVDDVAELADDRVLVLIAGRLHLYNDAWAETSRRALGIFASKLAIHGDTLYCFAQPSSGARPAVEKTTLAAFTSLDPAPLVNPTGRPIWSPQFAHDGVGNVYVYSKVDRNVLHWSAESGAWRGAIPLRGTPEKIFYSAAEHALLYERDGTHLHRVQLERAGLNAADTSFHNAHQVPGCFTEAWQHLVYVTDRDFVVIDREGKTRSIVENKEYSNYLAFSAEHKLLYHSGGVFSSAISEDGILGWVSFRPLQGAADTFDPVHLSPDNSRIATRTGYIVDAKTVSRVAKIPSFTHAAWQGNKLHTIAPTYDGTRLSRWSSNWEIEQRTEFAGRPLALFSLPGGELIMVTATNQVPQFRLIDAATQAVVPASSLTGSPIIRGQPEPARVSYADNARFAVVARGTAPLSYRWRRNGVPLDDIGGVRGSNGPVLLIERITAKDEASYDVVVTNNLGSITSSPATLTVTPAAQLIRFNPSGFVNTSRDAFGVRGYSTSGLPITLEVISGDAVIDPDGRLRFTRAGTVTVRATQPGNANYAPAAPSTATITMPTIPQTLSFPAFAPVRFTRTPLSLPATASSGLPVTYQIGIAAPATIDGNLLRLSGTGTISISAAQPGDGFYGHTGWVTRSLTVLPSMDSWLNNFFTAAEQNDPSIVGAHADPDGDGLSNLLEYALHSGSPNTAQPSLLPPPYRNGSDWVFEYRRAQNRPDLLYTVQVSGDLVDWTSVGVAETEHNDAQGTYWRATYPASHAPTLFFRLLVSQSP